MFGGKITLDRETFKVLAADTRIEILKRLSEHKETLTDISEAMKLSPSTVKEHLDKLVQAGLIEQIEADTKWKYYRLTRKGENIIRPHETNVLILLSASAIFLAGSLLKLNGKLTELAVKKAPLMMAEATLKAADATPSMAPPTAIPYLELILTILFALLTGIFAARLIRK
ncbi:MAG: winged helix-turn-helix domain-containing protein [Candidatus Altiarchaeota archaeon]